MSSDFVDCACTLVLQFPDDVYRSTGVSVVLPELLESVDVPKVHCVQFIRNGLVRVTFDDTVSCEAALSSGVVFRGARLPVSPVSARSRQVYVRDLPVEVSESFVEAALSSYGTVHAVTAMEHTGYPGLLNGTRLVKIVLEKDIPSSLHISGFECRVWYRGQPQACVICHSYRHRVRECPLNGLCRRCHQAGHVARECRAPRRPSTGPHEPLSALVDSNDSDSTEVNDVDYVPDDELESVSSISDDEEAFVSGDEDVLAEETVQDLPPRRPVSTSTSTVPTAFKRPLSPTGSNAPRSKVKSSSTVTVSSSPTVSLSSTAPLPRDVKTNVSSPQAKSSSTVTVSSSSTVMSAVVTPSCDVKPDSVPRVTASPAKLPAGRAARVLRPRSITGHAVVFRDRESSCGVSRIDFGAFTPDIIRDRRSFEYDRFVSYVHHSGSECELTAFSNIVPADTLPRLTPGVPLNFPVQINK